MHLRMHLGHVSMRVSNVSVQRGVDVKWATQASVQKGSPHNLACNGEGVGGMWAPRTPAFEARVMTGIQCHNTKQFGVVVHLLPEASP